MRDLIISSSVLILAILLIRYIVKGKISPLLQYMLWLPVALRLMLPFPVWSSSVSIMNLFPEENLFEDSIDEHIESKLEQQGQIQTVQKPKEESGRMTGDWVQQPKFQYINLKNIEDYLLIIWLSGILVIGSYMLFYQIRWKKYLHENRKLLEKANKYCDVLSVYTIEGLPSPCLSGRGIYLTEELAADEKQLAHVIAHEYCHYKHLDSLWVIVRCVLVTVYWFHPLVWAAAYVSKQDSELACDESAIHLLGEEERFAYGRTLIRLISGNSHNRNKMGMVSTMSGKEKGIKERINRIAGKQKNLFVVAGGVVIFVAALVIITFSSAEKALEKQEEALEKQEAELREQVEAQMEQAQEAALQAELEAQMEQIQRMEEQVENEAAKLKEEIQKETVVYANPCPSYTRISDSFGSRVNPVTGETIMHNGVDLAAEEGADVVAAEAGMVYQTGYNSEDGNYVILYHEVNETYTYYTACREILVTEGEQVEREQKIAKVGQSGRSTGSHLHFAVQENGEYIEPVFSERD